MLGTQRGRGGEEMAFQKALHIESLRVTDSDQAGCGDVGRCRQRGNLCGESAWRAHQGFESSLRCGPLHPLSGEETQLIQLCGKWMGTISGESSDLRACFPARGSRRWVGSVTQGRDEAAGRTRVRTGRRRASR